jgi:hypothetical protein
MILYQLLVLYCFFLSQAARSSTSKDRRAELGICCVSLFYCGINAFFSFSRTADSSPNFKPGEAADSDNPTTNVGVDGTY